MPGSAILDVAIGMAFIYLLLSLIASAIQEGIAAIAQSRASNLLQGLQSLFSGDKGPQGEELLLKQLYDHGLIRGLYRDPVKDLKKSKAMRPLDWFRRLVQRMVGMTPDKSERVVSNPMLLPAYIPSRTFALALIDILDPAVSGSQVTLERLRATLASAVATQPENKALQAISALADSAGYDLRLFQARLEDWYNDAMDRISGWYKKHTQNVLLVIGLVLAVVFNVNSIRVAETLWTNKDARDAMVDAAKQYVDTNKPPAKPQLTPEGPKADVPAAPGSSSVVPDQTGGTGAQPGDSGTQTALPTQTAGPGQPGAGAPNDPNAVWNDLASKIGRFQAIENQRLLPLGWDSGLDGNPARVEWESPGVLKRVSFVVVGWLITALALSLGASFWFDTLNRFMVIRNTIKPDEKSPNEPSKG